MKFHDTKIKGLYVGKLKPISDTRGFFVRSYCSDEFEKINIQKPIQQINHSLTSAVGSIRGMHFQYPPHAETKIVRCIAGEVFDVAVDLRKGSETFLQWYGEYLTPNNLRMMVIPEGFAHGFQVIKKNTEILYLHTASYTPEVESGIPFDDEKVGIEWPLQVTDISNRDRNHKIITEKFKGISL